MSDPQKLPRIFVVDDEPNIATTMATILRIHGFDATPFTEPLLALAAANSGKPDLLLSDVVMPLLSGIELAIQMQQQHPHCKVLLFSGRTDVKDLLAEAISQGHVFEVLLKPVPPMDLVSRIQQETGSATSPPDAMS